MSDILKAAAFRRAAFAVCAALGVAAASPALADPIDVITSVRVTDLTPPTSPAEQASLRNRIASAAEAACGSDSRSLAEYRYAVRRSQCFHDGYVSAMEQLNRRWGLSGGGAGR
jgi:UrcA family protein